MPDFPIRELTLYKNGIGHFVREGKAAGEVVTLAFDPDAVNDVLKSLNVSDRNGGQVLGFDYEAVYVRTSDMPKPAPHSLMELLQNLRGKRLTFNFERVSDQRTISNTHIGEIAHLFQELRPMQIAILDDKGGLHLYAIEHLKTVQGAGRADVIGGEPIPDSDKSRVIIRMSGGEHDLVLTYIAPSPTWRVSYRVLAESNTDGNAGKLTLLGWGLFDNLIEDLTNVRVTLVAGSPISFEYDLSSARIPQRQQVQDESYAAQGPVAFQAAAPAKQRVYSLSGEPLLGKARSAVVQAMQAPRDARKKMADDVMYDEPPPVLALNVGAPAQTQDDGEVFQYIVTQPVSIKRGVSALVPIIHKTNIPYTRHLIYNGLKVPNHPVATLQFVNATGLTLERGPATLVEGGDYKGEAVIPFTRDGAAIYLPYAVERGIKISEQLEQFTEDVGTTLEGEKLIRKIHHTQVIGYEVQNLTARDLTVMIERTREVGYDLFESEAPLEATAEYWRWRVTVPANSRITWGIKARLLVEDIQVIGQGCNGLWWLVRRWPPQVWQALRR